MRTPGSMPWPAVWERGIHEMCVERGARLQVNRVGSMLTLFFTETPVVDFATARKSDTAHFSRFFRKMLERGIYWPPSQFETAFVSTAHSESDIDRTVEAIGESL